MVTDGEFNDAIMPVIAAAHELKAPLALMRQLSLLLDNDADLTYDERLEIALKIRLTSEKSLRLTGDLTKVARLEDAMFELEPINPFELCLDVANELRPLVDSHRRTIKVLAKKKHPLLLVANRDLLRRVVMNFTDNALHYGNQDTSIEMVISTLSRGQIVRVAVRDYGPALRREVRRNLKRGSDRVSRVSGRPDSSGLGLYLASKFAFAMNGKIGAISHKDGATFYVDLNASSQLRLI